MTNKRKQYKICKKSNLCGNVSLYTLTHFLTPNFFLFYFTFLSMSPKEHDLNEEKSQLLSNTAIGI